MAETAQICTKQTAVWSGRDGALIQSKKPEWWTLTSEKLVHPNIRIHMTRLQVGAILPLGEIEEKRKTEGELLKKQQRWAETTVNNSWEYTTGKKVSSHQTSKQCDCDDWMLNVIEAEHFWWISGPQVNLSDPQWTVKLRSIAINLSSKGSGSTQT